MGDMIYNKSFSSDSLTAWCGDFGGHLVSSRTFSLYPEPWTVETDTGKDPVASEWFIATYGIF